MTTAEPRADVDIREAVRADLLDVFRIEKRSFSQPWPYAAFERFLGAAGFLIAEDDGIVGYIVADTVDQYGTRIGHIKDIAVSPECRREGIGQTLLSAGLSALAADGVGRIRLEVRRSNEAAQSLYEAYGFEIHHVRSTYYDDGEDAYVMVREW